MIENAVCIWLGGAIVMAVMVASSERSKRPLLARALAYVSIVVFWWITIPVNYAQYRLTQKRNKNGHD